MRTLYFSASSYKIIFAAFLAGIVLLGTGCSVVLKQQPLVSPTEKYSDEIGMSKRGEGIEGKVGWGRFTVFYIPIVPVHIQGDGNELVMQQIQDALNIVGYKVTAVDSEKDSKAPVLKCKVEKFWFNNYTYFFPIVPTWGSIELKITLVSPNGYELWRRDFRAKATTFNFFDGYSIAANKSMKNILNDMVREFSNKEFHEALKLEELALKKKLIPTDRGTPNVDWPYPRKEQLPAPPIEKAKPAITSKFADVTLPEYEISPPPANAPPEIRGLLGRWQGYWNNGVAIAMVFQKVYLEERKVECIHVWGHWGPNKDRKPGFGRHFANLTPGPKPQIKFRAGDGDFTFTLEGKLLHGTRKSKNGVIETTLEKVE